MAKHRSAALVVAVALCAWACVRSPVPPWAAGTARSDTRRGLPIADAAAEGLDAERLDEILFRAREENSSALVVLRHGKVVVDDYFDSVDTPIMAMSASKSIASLAVGKLVEEGLVASIDDLVTRYVPEFGSDESKRSITIRQLLNHTSGLSVDWFAKSESIERHVFASPLDFPPGTAFAYNNNAVDFISVIVRRASGLALDDYVQKKIFDPIGIVDARWKKDRDGNPSAAGELQIHALDLARIGQMMLERGKWGHEQVIRESWVDASVQASQSFDPTCGLLWWRHVESVASGISEADLERWAGAGVEGPTIDRARPLVGRRFDEPEDLRRALVDTLGGPAYGALRKTLFARRLEIGWKEANGPLRAFSADGWLGQRLVVVPGASIVAVRMRRARREDYRRDGPNRDGYSDFARDVIALAAASKEVTPPPSGAVVRPRLFEPVKTSPEFYENGWALEGGGASVFAIGPDRQVAYEGRAALRLRPEKDAGDRWGVWLRHLDAKDYVGRHVKMTIFLETTSVGAGNVWLRSRAKDSPGDGPGLGNDAKKLPASSPWMTYTLELDVPAGADYLEYGVGLQGPVGTVWMVAPRLELL